MTRLLVVPVFLAVTVAALFIIGLIGNSPLALVFALMCGSPLFMLRLGWAVGRASTEFSLVRKPPAVEISSTNERVRRSGVREPLS